MMKQRVFAGSVSWMAAAAGLALMLFAGVPENLAAASHETNSLSLAYSFPVEKLRTLLLPRDTWRPFPAFKEREAWKALSEEVATYLVQLGEEALQTPLPPLAATLYLGYARTGNRSEFEGVYFKRRAQLQNLVLAECVEGKGRFLDAAANALWSICEESTWCLPAHVGVQKARVGLPDVTEPIVDLFAGESAVTVSWSLYLLGSELNRVSVQLPRRAGIELRRRILTPVLERDDFGWMALNVTRPDQRPNNWTPWISASILATALLQEPDADRRVQIVHKMLRSLDGFLRFHPADGSCDEGPGYWGRAGGSLLDCLEVLRSATGGKLDVFGEPLVREIGRFIYRAHIDGDYFVPIGDCPARFDPEHSLVFRYGKSIGDPNFAWLAAHGTSIESILGSRFLGRQIYAVFNTEEILASASAPRPALRDVWLGSEDLELLTSRSKPGSSDGLYLAAWGGHNAQSHNHNDVGNILVFADGQPVFVDAGAPTYTAQTFSAKRYDHWAFQSAFHNVPTINGVMQSAGRQFATRDVRCETNDSVAELTMDIAAAYPAAAKVKSWIRTVRLNRGRDIELVETFELSEVTGETTLNFVTPLDAAPEPGRVAFSPSDNRQRAVNLRLEFDPSKLKATVERIQLNDTRLARSWGSGLNRLILHAQDQAPKDTWKLRIVRE